MCGEPVTKAPSTRKKAKHGLIFCSPKCHYAARSAGILKMPVRGPYKMTTKPVPHTFKINLLPPQPKPVKNPKIQHPVKKPTLNDSFGHWLAGFIAGEGCFRVHKAKKGQYYSCHFHLKQRDDDTAILQEIVEKTGLGYIQQDLKGRNNSKPCAVWNVHSKQACLQLVRILDYYPIRGRKARDYAIWKEAVMHWTSKGGGVHSDAWRAMQEFKKDIEDARKYRSPNNHSSSPKR